MSRRPLLAAAAALAAAAGCAHDVHARFPGADPDAATGTLVLRFTSAVDHAHVSVNGVPVAEGAHTERVTIDGVPAGDVTVMVASRDAAERAFVIRLEPDARMVVPLAGGGASLGRSVLQAVLGAAVYAAYLGLAAAL